MEKVRTRVEPVVRPVLAAGPVQPVKRLVHHLKKDDVTGLAAEIAYYWIFAIPPLLIVVVAFAAMLEHVAEVNVVGQLRDRVHDHAPADIASVLDRLIDSAIAEVSGGLASFGVVTALVVALWSGSNGMGALMKAFNRAYGIEEGRPFVRKRLVAIGLTVLLVVFLTVPFILLVYGERIGSRLADTVGAGDLFATLWGILRWPGAILVIIVFLALLYSIGPNLGQRIRWFTPGAVVAGILWILLVFGFGVYLRFSDPSSAYGVLGGVILLLFFLYLTGLVLVIGAEVNVIALERTEGMPAPASPGEEPSSTGGTR